MIKVVADGLARRAGVALVALMLASLPSLAQTKPLVRDTGLESPTSVIYIGNSFFYYNNGINHLAAGPRLAEKQRLRSTMATISGSGLDWHDVEAYFRPGAVGRYSIGADNTVTFNQRQPLFDLAVMMDCSQCPVHPQLSGIFFDYAKKHAETVRRHGAVPVLFMSWAYQDRPEMTADLAEAYTRAGNDNTMLVIPAGLAFARAVARRPDIGLYAADKRHPSRAGSYLAGMTVYATIFRKSPVGSPYTGGLDAETAAFLQSVAWDTVQSYFAP